MSEHTTYETYEVRTLDVWGNRKEGFWVNDAHVVGHVDIPNVMQDDNMRQAIVLVLRRDRYLASWVRWQRLDVQLLDEQVYIQTMGGFPLYVLNRVSDDNN